MKKILISFVFVMIFTVSFATNFTSVSSGTWTTSTIWSPNTSYPGELSLTDNVTLDNNDDITLPGTGVKIIVSNIDFNNNSILTIPTNDTLVCDSMTIWNRADLVVDGVLIVIGGVHMNNNSFLNILLDGVVDIGGDFYGGPNSDLNVDGEMIIDGEIDWNGDTPTGTGTINGYPPGELPVELLSFDVYFDSNVKIKWITASELNNDFFLIEKSKNLEDWKLVKEVSGNGTVNSISIYEIEDLFEKDYNYYRLSQIDFNGTKEIFNDNIRFINPTILSYKIYPNPAKINELIKIDNNIKNVKIYFNNKFYKEIENSNVFKFEKSGVYIIIIDDILKEKIIIN